PRLVEPDPPRRATSTLQQPLAAVDRESTSCLIAGHSLKPVAWSQRGGEVSPSKGGRRATKAKRVWLRAAMGTFRRLTAAYLSSHTSSRRAPLKMLLTKTIWPLT